MAQKAGTERCVRPLALCDIRSDLHHRLTVGTNLAISSTAWIDCADQTRPHYPDCQFGSTPDSGFDDTRP